MSRQELLPDILPSDISQDDMRAHIAALINKVNREVYQLENKIAGLKVEMGTAAGINREKFKKNSEEHGHFQLKDAEILKVFNEVVVLLKKIEQSVEKLEPERVISFMDTMQPALKQHKDLEGFWNTVKKYWLILSLLTISGGTGIHWFWTTFEVGIKAWLKSVLGN